MRFALSVLVAAVAPAAGARVSGFRESEGQRQRAGGASGAPVGGLQDDEDSPVPPLKGQQAAKVRSGAGGCIGAGQTCQKGRAALRCCEGLVGQGALKDSDCTSDVLGKMCEAQSWAMIDHGQGYCTDGYYAGWDDLGIASQEACNDVCLSEAECTFAAWYPDQTCSRYNRVDCDLIENSNHYTYKKVYSDYCAPTPLTGTTHYWYDADGVFYDCDWYAEYARFRCVKFGHLQHLANFGKTADQACCVCADLVHESDPGPAPDEYYYEDNYWYGADKDFVPEAAKKEQAERAAHATQMAELRYENEGLAAESAVIVPDSPQVTSVISTSKSRLLSDAKVTDAQTPALRKNKDLTDEKPALVVPDAVQDISAGGSELSPNAHADATHVVRKNKDLAAEIRPHVENAALEDVAAL